MNRTKVIAFARWIWDTPYMYVLYYLGLVFFFFCCQTFSLYPDSRTTADDRKTCNVFSMTASESFFPLFPLAPVRSPVVYKPSSSENPTEGNKI